MIEIAADHVIQHIRHRAGAIERYDDGDLCTVVRPVPTTTSALALVISLNTHPDIAYA